MVHWCSVQSAPHKDIGRGSGANKQKIKKAFKNVPFCQIIQIFFLSFNHHRVWALLYFTLIHLSTHAHVVSYNHTPSTKKKSMTNYVLFHKIRQQR